VPSAILRSARPVDASRLDLEQASRLRDYLTNLRDSALVLSYQDDLELQSHVDAILNTAVSRDRARAELQLQAAEDGTPGLTQAVAEVWPRVESDERVKSDSRNRLRTTRRWYLVLANTGDAPARNVEFRIEVVDAPHDAEAWVVHTGRPRGEKPEAIESLAPGGDIRFPILASLGTVPQARCVVTWEDDRGEQENVATLRLA
jgi:hypothetical protein